MTCLAATPPPVDYNGPFIDREDYEHATLHVLPGSLEAYQSALYWKNFSRIVGDAVIQIPGDVNGDGELTIADANSVIEVVVNGGSGGHGHAPGDDDGTLVADVNGDGEINIADINAIIDMILAHQ